MLCLFLLTIWTASSSKFSSARLDLSGEYVWEHSSRFHAQAGEGSDTGNVPRNIDHAYYNTSFISSQWVDISRTGILADCSFVDDNPQDAVELPFLFPFYGHQHNQLFLSSNGFISTVSVQCEGFCNWHAEQGDSWYARYIGPFMTDLDPSASTDSKVMYQFESNEVGRPSSLVVSWINVGLWNHTQQTFSFQAILRSTGDIQFNYKDLPFNPTETMQGMVQTEYPLVVGLEDAVFTRMAGSWSMSEYRPLDILYTDLKSNPNVLGGQSVLFIALESCLDFVTCESCDTIGKRTGLNCAWCPYDGVCVDKDGRNGADVTDQCYTKDETISSALQCGLPLPPRDGATGTNGGGDDRITDDGSSDDTEMFLILIIVGVVLILLAVGFVCFWLNSKLRLLRQESSFERLDGEPAGRGTSRQTQNTFPPLETDTAV